MSRSTYWIKVRVGLISPEHVTAIGPAVWCYLWLLRRVTKQVGDDGEVLGGAAVSTRTISDELGLSVGSVHNHMLRLERTGYVRRKRSAAGTSYTVLRWASVQKSEQAAFRNLNGSVQKPERGVQKPERERSEICTRRSEIRTHIIGSREELEKNKEKNRSRRRTDAESNDSIQSKPTQSEPPTKRETTILEELTEIDGLQPAGEASRLKTIRRAVKRHPNVDHLRIARELRDWFADGNGRAIRKRTMDRYTRWVQRVASDSARAQEYHYVPGSDELEELRSRVRGGTYGVGARGSAAGSIEGGSGGGASEDGAGAAVDRQGAPPDPGSGDGNGQERPEAGPVLPEVSSLVAGVAERMGRR